MAGRAERKTRIERGAGQSSFGAVPTDQVYTADEYEEDIYPAEAFDFHDYRSSNSSVSHLTPRRHRREMEEGTRRRRCRRKGRRQKAQPHVHYEAAEYSVVNVAGIVSFWQQSDWFAPEGCWFVLKTGHVRVKEAGVYWIYAQVSFDDRKDAVRAQVLLGGRGDRPPTPVLTCDGDEPITAGRRTRTCYMGGIRRLDRNDRISVEAWGGVKAAPDYTYFGLLKLGI
uniref:THD domain-containing protein n=2 Tax=Branchiostoma floridae TaxID=7739 RepID=C3ZDW3_BRAFL|eukprot:XP_002592908.1 hypothetical protein BRAFLDRAFT_65493 [Branchiostoma floridae]